MTRVAEANPAGCHDCPLLAEFRGENYCNHPSAPDVLNDAEIFERKAGELPASCPLRKEPLLARLKGKTT